MFQSDLAQIGINLKIISDTWANITSNTGKAESTPDLWIHWVVDLLRRSRKLGRPDVRQPVPRHLEGLGLVSERQGRRAACARPAASTDQAERQPLYEEATRLIVADSPDIWVYNTVEIRGLTDRVKGFRFSPVGSGGEMRWVQLE